MTFDIKSLEDVYKFSLSIYDYLKENGYSNLALMFEQLVDSCFESESDSIVSHRKAYKKVLEEVVDLPSEYRVALEESLDFLK